MPAKDPGNKVKHGPLTVEFDIGEVSTNGDVEMTIRHPDGERQSVKINGLALIGVSFKFAAQMMKNLDVVQRTLEELRV